MTFDLTSIFVSDNTFLVESFLKNGMDPNSILPDDSATLLVAALRARRSDIVKILLEYGANPNVPKGGEKWFSKPLYVALIQGDREMVSLLLKSGASLEKVEKDRNAFHVLATMNHAPGVFEGVAEILIDHGCDPDERSKAGFSPLHFAVQSSRMDSIKWLLKKGASINWLSIMGESPLFIASGCGRADIIKLLLDNGANPNLASRSGDTCLHQAVLRDRDMNVKLLIEAGACLNTKNANQRTPLINAAWECSEKSMRRLIDGGADLNSMDDGGETALMKAVLRGFKPGVEMLVRAGADVDMKNMEGKTACMINEEGSGSDWDIRNMLLSGKERKMFDSEAKGALSGERKRI